VIFVYPIRRVNVLVRKIRKSFANKYIITSFGMDC